MSLGHRMPLLPMKNGEGTAPETCLRQDAPLPVALRRVYITPTARSSKAGEARARRVRVIHPFNSREARPMPTDIDTRRRRAAYRAAHRGTKEMDWLVGRYADAVLPTLEDPALERFEMLLAEFDPALQAWLLNGKAIESSEFGSLIAEIRVFHGLDGKT